MGFGFEKIKTKKLFQQVRYVRQQSQVPCPLDGGGDTALVLQGVAGDTAGKHFALFVDELKQEIRIFVVDIFDAELTETAVFLAFLTKVRVAEKLDIVS